MAGRGKARAPLAVKRSRVKSAKKQRLGRASRVIALRADDGTRRLIDTAASALGQNRTEFMLASAKMRAQEVLLDRTHFVLSERAWAGFQAALEAPPVPNSELVALLSSTPPWSD